MRQTVHVLGYLCEQVDGLTCAEITDVFCDAVHGWYGHELDDVLLTRLPHVLAGAGAPLITIPTELLNDTDGSDNVDTCVQDIRWAGWDAERLLDALIYLETYHHHGLVLLAAGRLARNSPQDSDEMLAYGWLGLRVALRKFNPERGHRFSTYAMTRITGAIRDGIRDEDPLPKRLVTDRNRAKRANDELCEKLGRTPTLAELAEVIGEKLAEMLPRLGRSASLEEMQETFTATADVDVSSDVEQSLLRSAVDNAMSGLGSHHRFVAEHVLRDGMTVRKAATELGMLVGDVEQMLTECRQHLEHHLSAWA